MGLRDVATADLNAIMSMDFGWSVSVIDPLGAVADIKGFTSDIAETIDPNTGQVVSGRLATVALPLKALTDADLGIPSGVVDLGTKPWRVIFADTAGTTYTFKVVGSHPDRALGLVTCELELCNDTSTN
jgi:hypothetical protein